ncbi:MAG: DUF4421 family protein [Muribaculaceae bacterium]|nr:DUF4421 family protein [Muribaculaceae bacterium]
MMKRWAISLLMTLVAALAWSSTTVWQPDSIFSPAWQDSIDLKIKNIEAGLDSVQANLDSLKENAVDLELRNRWEHLVFRHGWSINDTSIVYPPTVDFGVKVYRWLNHALNYYDTAYVVNPGRGKKKFKVMLKNSNWLDFYSGHLGKWEAPIQLNSDVTSLFGFHISGMGLSFTYMINARDLLAGRFIHNRRLQFSFTTSRIFIEGYYRKNDQSSVHLHRLGKWMGSELFYGLTREGYGLDAYYIFNHTHYSQAAAYCFSKYQKRSAGSLMTGIYLSHQDVVMDMTLTDQTLLVYLPNKVTDYRFRYRDFGVMIGYGYSWVFHHGWLFNVTAVPSIGYRHSFPNSIDGKRSLLSTNLNGRMALVRTAGNFFYALTFSHEGHWYQSVNHSFYNSYSNLEVTAGFRF